MLKEKWTNLNDGVLNKKSVKKEIEQLLAKDG
jgi:hypothetical protein